MNYSGYPCSIKSYKTLFEVLYFDVSNPADWVLAGNSLRLRALCRSAPYFDVSDPVGWMLAGNGLHMKVPSRLAPHCDVSTPVGWVPSGNRRERLGDFKHYSVGVT